MAVGGLSPVGIQQFFDANGDPLAGGKLFFYLAGTETPTPAYADVNLTIPLANPVILDAAGRAPELFLGAVTYKQVLKDANDVTIWTADNIVTPSALRSVSATTSITGDQHSVPVPQGLITYLSFTNATPLTIDGFSGGTPGQMLVLSANGPGLVHLVNHASSLSPVGHRLHNPVGSGPMSMTQFAGGAMYLYVDTYWRLIWHEQGHWIRIPYDAANFTVTSGGPWTVEPGDIQQMDYKLIGTSMLVTVAIENSSLATAAQHLVVNNWPYEFATAVRALPASGRNAPPTYELAAMGLEANTRSLVFALASLVPWAAAANTCNLFGQGVLDVK